MGHRRKRPLRVEQPLLPLNAGQATLENTGGKGLNLSRLLRAGFPVPPGFIVRTDAYDAFVRANRLAEMILKVLQATPLNDPGALEAASRTIRARFSSHPLPASLIDALNAAYADLGQPPVAVRSSATAEDLPGLSFAGQQDTFLNVVGVDALQRAVIDCWSSLWTARAIGYRARNGIDQENVSLAVIVQEMVPSGTSGVLFTANPLTGKRTEMVIDATFGLAEALVSGQIEPDHYVVDAFGDRILSRALGRKATVIRGQEGGGTVTLQQDAADRQTLPDARILELAQLGRRVAGLFGAPQDIEWATVDGRLYLLQSRPITTLYPVPEGMPPEPLFCACDQKRNRAQAPHARGPLGDRGPGVARGINDSSIVTSFGLRTHYTTELPRCEDPVSSFRPISRSSWRAASPAAHQQ